MNASLEVAGVLPVVHTPFDNEDRIDFEVLQVEVDWALEQGANGLVVGMASEIQQLGVTERQQLIERLVSYSRGRGVVVASVGADTTAQTTI